MQKAKALPGFSRRAAVFVTAVMILTDGTKTSNPACSVTTNQFAVPLSNSTAIAFLLSARATGTTVTIGGSGGCATVSGTENFQWAGY